MTHNPPVGQVRMTPDQRVRHDLRLARLSATRVAFGELILCGQPDPHRELFAGKRALVVGPAGSRLFAMVRVPVTGGRMLYRRLANRALHADRQAVALIEERFLTPALRLETSPKRNPVVVDAAGKAIERLEWHHSPNHILTVCLIPQRLHRSKGLHAEGRGGHDMFWLGVRRKAKPHILKN